MSGAREFIVSMPSGVEKVRADSYEIVVDPDGLRRLILRVGERVVGEFQHFAGVWEVLESTSEA